eukprot:TRINITY_DN6174_c0_g1_i1.p1 TRINITY_DN6174_c0_g1~~TRINITY_DN6174_c0_g1_i1.p1  ORF type:complete len:702 (+),score=126.46 TRINITY_DN6174_c0_g1_i1:90-2108(+)
MEPMLRSLRRCVRWDTDDLAERTRKAIGVPMFSGALVLAFIAIYRNSQQGAMLSANTYGSILVAAASAGVFANLAATRRIPLWLIETTTPAVTCGILCIDWSNAAVPGKVRSWSLTVLVMDALLVVGGSRFVQGICLHGAAVWLMLSAAEDGYRLGLYNIAHWSRPPEEQLREHLSCGDPPCAVGALTALGSLALYLAVLYLDYQATRTFAEGMRKETERVRAMVGTAELVSECLARFDLLDAHAVLERDAGGITAELTNSFRRLLSNLASYKPYLPQSCFEHAAGDAEPPVTISPLEMSRVTTVGATTTACASSPRTGSLLQLPRRGSHSCTLEVRRQSGFSAPPISRRPSRTTGPRIGHAPQQRRVAMLLSNRVGLLGALAQSAPGTLALWLAADVARFCEAVQQQGGVVDALSADHMRASFGALGVQQSSARTSATRCAATIAGLCGIEECNQHVPDVRLADSVRSCSADEPGDCFRQLPRTSAVCGGQVVCGDFGSSDTLRFMVIGAVAAFAGIVERAAAAWGIPVLADTDICDEVCTSWNCRLRKMVRFGKHRSSNPTGLWEVVSHKPERRCSQGEWMYQLAAVAPDPWETYNTAVQLWCRADHAAALERLAMVADRGGASEPDVQQAEAALRDALSEQQPPPLSVVPPGAGLGAPAPTCADEIPCH